MWLFNLFGKAKNLGSDVVTPDVKKERLDVCKSCPHYRKDFRTLLVKKENISQCGICKCALNAKTTWLNEECPVNKW